MPIVIENESSQITHICPRIKPHLYVFYIFMSAICSKKKEKGNQRVTKRKKIWLLLCAFSFSFLKYIWDSGLNFTKISTI